MLHAQGVGHRAGVKGPGSTEGDQGQAPGVHPPLHGHGPHGLGHGLIDHRRHPSGRGPGSLQGGPGRSDVEAAQAREGRAGGDPPCDQVGVGDGGLGPAPAVAGGAGHGPGRPGADGQGSPRVDAGDGAAPGADGVDVERGHAHGEAGDRALGRGLGHPSQHQAHVGARPAHVEGDAVGEAGGHGHRRRGPHPTGWAGQQQPGRAPGRLGRRDQPPSRGHHQHLFGQAFQPAQVGGARRRQVGAHHGGDGPLVFAELGGDVARAHRGQPPGRQGAGCDLLVGRGQVGVEQAHGHDIDRAGHPGHGGLLQRLQLTALAVEPAPHLDAEVARDQGLGPVGPQVVQRWPPLTGDLDHVCEACRREQGHGRPPPLEQGVGGHRRPVGQQAGTAPLAGPGGTGRVHRPDPVAHGLGGVGRRRRDLGHGAIGRDHVGEGSARVHAQGVDGCSHTGRGRHQRRR